MSGTLEVSTALSSRLTAAAPGAALVSALIKRENFPDFKPPATGFWYQPWFLPGEPHAAAIGESAQNRHPWVFQIDVYCPRGKGTGTLAAEAERIAACYKRGTSLTNSGVIAICEKSWVVRNPTQDDAAYYKQIVRVQGWADVAN